MKKITTAHGVFRYVCPVCHKSHAFEAQAEACCAKPRFQCSECDMGHETARDELLCCNPVMGTGEPGNRQVGGDHYTAMPVQPWDVIDTWPREQAIGYYRGNALKYLLRAGSKGDAVEDVRKAEHYCAKLATMMAGGE